MNRGAVITTRNEAETIGTLVEALAGQGLHVVVIDDRSTDGTAEIAREAGAFVRSQEGPPGLATGLLEAWNVAIGPLSLDQVIQIDAGASHDPREAARLFARLDAGADVVIGSRFCQGARYVGGPRSRPVLSRLAAKMCNFATAGRYSDWTSGYRAFRRRALLHLLGRPYRARMHGWQIEVLAYAHGAGLSIAEVPITYRAGRSSFNWRVAGEAFQVWLDILDHPVRYSKRALA